MYPICHVVTAKKTATARKNTRCRRLAYLLGLCLLCVSCAEKNPGQRMEGMEASSEETQQRLAVVENKLDNLDARVGTLSKDVQGLTTGSYEVRTKAGKKTGMTAHYEQPVPRAVVVSPQAATPPALPPQTAEAKAAAPAQPARGNPSHAPMLPPTEGASTPQPQVSLALPPEQSQGVTPPPVPAKPTPAPVAKTSQAPPPAPIAAPPAASLALPPEQSTATAPPAVAPSGKLPPSTKDEQSAYNAALSLVTSGRAVEGREKFQEFLQKYPSGRFAANAYYWIGESYYSQRNYPEALLQFKQATTLFPRHHKSADALLKAGMTYQKLGDKENADLQFKALISDFPQSEAARIARSKGWGR